MSKRLLSFVSLACALLLWTTPTQASTITFSGLVGANGAPFSNYAEAGFTVTSAGGFVEAHAFGNPIPDLFGPAGSIAGNVTVKLTAGGDFTFNSVDLANPTGANPNYLFEGFLGGNPVFSSGGVLGNPGVFVNIASPSNALIDTLRISYSLGAPSNGSVINVDNIGVTAAAAAVPEPASLLLLGSGLAALGARRRRNRRQRG